MDMKDILTDFKKDLARAHEDMKMAKELLEMGEEMKFDIAKRRAEIRDIELKISRFESVIDKRLSKEK